jgi:uncharacterized membrane protein YhaH (DUF805 family)
MSDFTAASYSPRERFWLAALAFVGFVGLNGMFLYGMLARPDAMASTFSNPVALAFMLEALLLVPVLAYLLGRWGVTRLHWGWFVALSFAGGIAFALPLALLWSGNRKRTPPAPR